MKKGIYIGITILFIVSTVSPMVFGYNAICGGDNVSCSCIEDDSLGYIYDEEPFHKNFPCPWEELSYYDPDTLTNVIGLINLSHIPMYWDSAVRFTEDELDLFHGWSFSRVIVALSCDNGQDEVYANLTIYGEGTPTKPGNIIYQDTGLYFNTTGFHTIKLDESIPFDDHDEIWVAMTWEQWEDPAYIPFADEGPAVDGKGDWVRIAGGTWSELQTYGLDYNWGMGILIGWPEPVLKIMNVEGAVGVKAEIKNVGDGPAHNLRWNMNIYGGILGMVDKSFSGNRTKLPVDATEAISSGVFIGIGRIKIKIVARADLPCFDDETKKMGFLLGPFVFVIR